MCAAAVSKSSVIRIVPKTETDEGDLASLANEEDWLLARAIEGDGEAPTEWIVCTPDRRTSVHWIKDPKINVPYLLVKGDEKERIAERVRREFDSYSLPEVMRLASDASNRIERKRAIYALSLLAPDDLDEDVFRLYALLAASDDPEVRGATVLGMSYVGWPRFADLLTALVGDRDPTVSLDARILLDNMKTYPARSVIPR
jgi:hypothetical protein